MKKKLVELTPPIGTRKMGWWVTVQLLENILVLNIHKNKILLSRHCVNVDTGEYATLTHMVWTRERIHTAVQMTSSYIYYYSGTECRERLRMSKESEELILSSISHKWSEEPYKVIDDFELQYDRDGRERKENNRVDRINRLMARVPETPSGIKEWINQRAIGGEDYATKTEDKGIYACSVCGNKCKESDLKRADGSDKARHKDRVLCPACGKTITLIKRKKAIDIWTRFAVIQPIDDEISVVRYFDAEIQCSGGRKKIGIDEGVRNILFKDKPGCDLYYNQDRRGAWWTPEGKRNTVNYFDNKTNRCNRRMLAGYLYDGGIEEAFKGTSYTSWSRLFTEFARAGLELNYNRMMCANDRKYIDITEMLFRGRFQRLLLESSEDIGIWSGGYCGPLKLYGNTIEDAFDIGDRQKINRIREKNGGEDMLRWMRWAEEHGAKLSDKVLDWLIENGIRTGEISWITERMSIEQTMNYIERQRRESYPGKSARSVIGQYQDYMNMCAKLRKNIDDAMVYRPRELKRRHDEAVAECQAREAELQADEYTRKYPEAEQALEEVKEKYAYADDDYTILVPERLIEIVMEGRALHHCVANTDRYFDRMASHETYICFLRKNEEPEKPYYTIEVEPGGTIRQHRGYLDEEPEIEQVKPFLKKWQQEIRKRMTEEDHRHAAVSAEKRAANIRELEMKNNTRVLQGLMEDFMEAI